MELTLETVDASEEELEGVGEFGMSMVMWLAVEMTSMAFSPGRKRNGIGWAVFWATMDLAVSTKLRT